MFPPVSTFRWAREGFALVNARFFAPSMPPSEAGRAFPPLRSLELLVSLEEGGRDNPIPFGSGCG